MVADAFGRGFKIWQRSAFGRQLEQIAATIMPPDDRRDLRIEPLVTRRRLLARLVPKPRCGLVLNAQFEQDGPLLLLACFAKASSRSAKIRLIPILKLSDLRLPNRGARWT